MITADELVDAAHATVPDGSVSPADAVLHAAGHPACVELLAHEDERVVHLALHLGSGPDFCEALLARLEAGEMAAEVGEEALAALIDDDIAHDALRNARAGAILAEAGRFDLLMCLLGRDDPHRMLLEAFEQVVRKPPLDPALTGLVAARLAVTRPSDLPRAAALIRNVRGQHATFVNAAKAANPGLLPAIQVDIRAMFGG